MPLLKRLAPWTESFLVLLLFAGCGDNHSVYPVRGKVLFEGKPMVGGGSISLVPLDNQPGKTAGGMIAEDGTYKLTTYSENDGSMPGEFRVVVFQVTDQEGEKTKDGEKPSKTAKPVYSVPAADRIPAVYADSMQSPLRAKIEAKSLNEINFDLQRL